MKKERLFASRLYLILDAEVLEYGRLLDVIEPAIRGGVDIFQLRDKRGRARDTLDLARKIRKAVGSRALFIVNDRVDIALFSGADGVHLGQDDLPSDEARKCLGDRSIIGRSCQTLEHVVSAQNEGADYIGFGSVFSTQTKPGRQPVSREVFDQALREAVVPFFPIGGITHENIHDVMLWGARRVAVCREILLAEDPGKTALDLKKVLHT